VPDVPPSVPPLPPQGQRRRPARGWRALGVLWMLFSGSLLAGAPWAADPWARAWAAWGPTLGNAMATPLARASCVGLGALLLLVASWDLVQLVVGSDEA